MSIGFGRHRRRSSEQSGGGRVLASQSMAVAVMPACAATGSQTRNPVTTAAIAKRISLRMALLLPDYSGRDTENSAPSALRFAGVGRAKAGRRVASLSYASGKGPDRKNG
jgi:hypothetical protein